MSPEKRQKIIDNIVINNSVEIEYEKICQKIHQSNPLNLEQKTGLKQMIIHVESITLLVKLNLKLQC